VLLLLAITGWSLRRAAVFRLPWSWFIGSVGIKAVAVWLSVATYSNLNPTSLTWIHSGLLVVSMTLQFIFGIACLQHLGGARLRLSVVLPFLLFALAGAIGGSATLGATSRYALGLPAGLLTGAVFWRLARRRNTPRVFYIVSLAFIAHALLVGLFPGPARVFPARLLNSELFLDLFYVPVEIPRAGCLFIILLSFWQILYASRDEEAKRLGLKLPQPYLTWFPPVLLLILVIGWFLLATLNIMVPGGAPPSLEQIELLHETRLVVIALIAVLSVLICLLTLGLQHSAEETARAALAEARMSEIIENFTDTLFSFTPDGVISAVGPEGVQLLGTQPEDLIGCRLSDLVSPRSWEFLSCAIRGATAAQPAATSGLLEVRTADGRIVYLETVVRPVVYSGQIARFNGIARDITSRVQSERQRDALRDLALGLAGAGHLEVALRLAISAAMRMANVAGGIIYLRSPDKASLELAAQEGLPSPVPPELLRIGPESSIWIRIQTGEPWFRTLSGDRSYDGLLRDFGIRSIGIIPILRQGAVIGSLGVGSAVTDDIGHTSRDSLIAIAAQIGDVIVRLEAERDAAASRIELQLLFDSVLDMIFILNRQGTILHANRQAHQRLGYSYEELRGRNMLDLHHPKQRQEAKRTISAIWRGETSLCTLPLMAKDGRLIPVETNTAQGHLREQQVLIGISRDISERIKAEAALRESEERFRIAADSADYVIYEWEPASDLMKIAGGPSALARIFGVDNVESQKDWERLIHLGDVDRVSAAVRDHLHGDKPFAEQYRLVLPGGEVCHCYDRATLLRDNTGRPAKWIGVCANITARTLAEAELQAAKEAAESANKAKSQFLANMSHELRTPINGIMGMIDVLMDSTITERQREFLTAIQDSADLLNQLIEDVLAFSRLDSGALPLRDIPFKLTDLFAGLASGYEVVAQQKGLTFQIDLPAETHCPLRGDPVWLRQILVNLIGNAFKFTETGRIDVTAAVDSLSDSHVMLHFAVRDTGLGIPEDKQGLIFDAFSQADNSTTRSHSGTGLGLAIAKELVERMNGQIWVESRLGQGSMFHFTAEFALNDPTRLAEPVDEAIPAAVVLEDLPDEHRQPSPETETPPSVSSAPADGSPGLSLPPMRILLAEDHELNAKVTTILLERAGHTVTVARDGREAVKLWQGSRFDLILMDILMPVMDGYGAAQEIRRQERARREHIPIIALTASVFSGEISRCFEAGMDGYVAKPIRINMVLDLIAHTLERLKQDAPSPPLVAGLAPEQPHAHPGDIYDHYQALQRMNGDEQLLEEMMRLFLDEYEEHLGYLEDRLAAADAVELRRVAHMLKGQAAIFGAEQARAQAQRLQTTAEIGDMAQARTQLDALRAEFARVAGAFRSHLDQSCAAQGMD